MRQRNHPPGTLALIGVAMLALAVPAMAQEAPPETAEDEGIPVVPPDGMDAFTGPPSVLAPDGSSTIVREAGRGSGVPDVLAILAHPDDELTIAPILARIRREGGNVTLVFVTSGDAGPGFSGLAPGDELAALREDEARCAAFGLGLDEPIFWRFGDGTLADTARSTDPAMRDLGERIAQLIAIEKPRMVMTWGPDGGYGHADHRMVSNAVAQLVQAMGAGRPNLLFAALPAPEEGSGTASLPGFEGWALTHPSLITDRIRYEINDLDAAQVAAGCYVSQFDETARAVLTDMLHDRIWKGTIMFREAFPGAQ